MLWPRHVWWTASALPADVVSRRCAGCDAPLAATEGAPAPGAIGAAAAPPADETAAAPAGAAAGFHYCSRCERGHARHLEAAQLGAMLGLLGSTACALTLPLFLPGMGLATHLLLTLLVAALPIAGLGSLPRRVGLWGSAPRAWPLGRSGVVLERPELARELERGGARGRPMWLPPIVYRGGVSLLPAFGLVVAGFGYSWHHPRLWALNVGSAPLTLLVDGLAVARLAPAGLASSDAVLLRLPSGVRRLAARDDAGASVADESVTLSRGREHLFAPGGSDECFWLERTGYGRDATHDTRALRSSSRFFTLDEDVDGWLSGSPPPPAQDRRSTGGTLTLLRHSPCQRAPESVRRAASAAGP
ncbi:MAG TPA: hypothetical protein VNN80_22775 [Polyangiaceae bacterium]|nr:hypothetical protein [Polyangiaceae bacterium]